MISACNPLSSQYASAVDSEDVGSQCVGVSGAVQLENVWFDSVPSYYGLRGGQADTTKLNIIVRVLDFQSEILHRGSLWTARI